MHLHEQVVLYTRGEKLFFFLLLCFKKQTAPVVCGTSQSQSIIQAISTMVFESLVRDLPVSSPRQCSNVCVCVCVLSSSLPRYLVFVCGHGRCAVALSLTCRTRELGGEVGARSRSFLLLCVVGNSLFFVLVFSLFLLVRAFSWCAVHGDIWGILQIQLCWLVHVPVVCVCVLTWLLYCFYRCLWCDWRLGRVIGKEENEAEKREQGVFFFGDLFFSHVSCQDKGWLLCLFALAFAACARRCMFVHGALGVLEKKSRFIREMHDFS